ncbi:hypothetical protein SAMN06272721_1305 [Arthrobacter sp. P2b]|nr:hypothetical protein SAMN06272721_1305 [Arthrobacter sp. P2b]
MIERAVNEVLLVQSSIIVLWLSDSLTSGLIAETIIL